MNLLELEHKIVTKKRFSTAVEKLVANTDISYLDAILLIIEENGIDMGNISNLLTDSLKSKLEVEAVAANLITGEKGNTLPI